jgi:hypothetical protein
MTKICDFGFQPSNFETFPRHPRKTGFCAVQYNNKLLINKGQLMENMVSDRCIGQLSVRNSNATSR